MQYIFCQNVRVLPDCILCPTNPSFSNYPALSPSPYLRKLIHLTIHKNTTPYPTNNPANPPGIKVSAREGKRFPHAPFVTTKTHTNIFFHIVPQNSLDLKEHKEKHKNLLTCTDIYCHILKLIRGRQIVVIAYQMRRVQSSCTRPHPTIISLSRPGPSQPLAGWWVLCSYIHPV